MMIEGKYKRLLQRQSSSLEMEKLQPQSVVIPCDIAGKNVSLKIEFVKSEIPLLLSKESMKAAESKIDFVNDRIYLVKIFTYTLQLVGIMLFH